MDDPVSRKRISMSAVSDSSILSSQPKEGKTDDKKKVVIEDLIFVVVLAYISWNI